MTKYDELRSKTERQLHELIERELETGMREAQQALHCEDWEVGKSHYLRAQRAHITASRMILLVDAAAAAEKDRWITKLRYLREMIDGLLVLASDPRPTSDNIASLARALWDARGRRGGSPEEDWFRAEATLRSHSAACC